MNLASPIVNKRGNTLHVSHGSDDGLYVEFYMEAEHQPFESEKQGIPVYKEVPYIAIMFPGDSTKKVVRPSTDADVDRFPKQWQFFKNQSTASHDGTPIDEWPPITKAVAMMLKGMNIHTVQQLACIPDHSLTWIGARDLRDKASAYIAAATDGAAVLKLQTDNQNLKNEIEILKAQFEEMAKDKKTLTLNKR